MKTDSQCHSVVLQDPWNCFDMFILMIDLLRLGSYSGYKQRILLAMTSFRGFRVMIRQPSIRNLISALMQTLGPVSSIFVLGTLTCLQIFLRALVRTSMLTLG